MTDDLGGSFTAAHHAAESPGLQRRLETFGQAIVALDAAPGFAKSRYQTQVFSLASELLDSDEGIRKLLELTPRMVAAGVFHGGPWEHGSRLLPRIVGYSLRGEGVNPTIEALSELRMLAIVLGTHEEEGLDAEMAEQFLQEVCVQNLDLMYPESSAERRARPKIHARAERLFGVVREHISIAGFGTTLVEEVETICAQRPIVTRRVRRMLDLAGQLPEDTLAPELLRWLGFYTRAFGAVTEFSERAADPAVYGQSLPKLSESELAAEAKAFAHSIHQTGLTSPYHSVLLRHVTEYSSELLADVLGLTKFGVASLDENRGLVEGIVREAIRPGTEIGVLGLAKTLDRGLLSRPEIRAGVRRLLEVELNPTAAKRLTALKVGDEQSDATALLVAGTLSVLGQPLGIGQGNNPTCQAARALSLWSQHAPGLLLKILVRAVRDGIIHTGFEQHDLLIRDEPEDGLDASLDLDLDPVSAVLVPLLNRLYTRLLSLTQGRASDSHRWVNPAMYGNWVPGGFASAFDPITGAVVGHDDFVRLFYATHHPVFNGGYDLVYPNPVGIILTDVHGNMLGYHAVSVQRIADDSSGGTRVYFFNPNNEGRQRWGRGVSPTVAGNGERPGESSLPFGQFASRLYAFHYDHYEKGDPARISTAAVVEVARMSRGSWGRSVFWADPEPDGQLQGRAIEDSRGSAD